MLGKQMQDMEDDAVSLKTQTSQEFEEVDPIAHDKTSDSPLPLQELEVDVNHQEQIEIQQATLCAAMDLDENEHENIKQELEKSNYSSGKEANFQMMLKTFYQRLFPFKEFYKWLSYGAVTKNYFANREFSFTLISDTYLRFKSFNNDMDLKNEIIRLLPVKIDIGAVYNFPPINKKTTNAGFVPKERELVFDIDMTDYDEIRTCCSGGDICHKCWQFMTLAIRIIDRALREDFGFKHMLWVYSGRRGVHCWVSDKKARSLPAEARRAIISYLEIIKGGEHTDKKVLLKAAMHPSTRKAFHILEKNFSKIILNDMQILSNKETSAKILALIPDDEIRRELDMEWDDSDATPLEKWNQIVNILSKKERKGKNLTNVTRDIIIQYTYPRLDSNVSIGLNHLLKAPFCVHPKTGRVCVPIDPKNCESFDPFQVPTLTELIQELDNYSSMSMDVDSGKRISDVEKTSLKPHIDEFKKFLNGLTEEIRQDLRAKRAEEEKSLSF